jgi:hypothetical protein
LGEDFFEVFDGAEGDEGGLGEGGVGGQGFGAGGDYIDVRKCKCAGGFAEESGLLVVRFDESEMDVGGPELEGKGGESSAGADVEDTHIPTQAELGWGTRFIFREEMAGEEEGLAEVAGDDFFFLADGCEVDAGVPALQ